MIKTIIFDNHGVLCHNDTEGGFDSLSRVLGKDVSSFKNIFWDIESMTFKGEVSPNEQFMKFAKEIKTNVSPKDIQKITYSGYTPRPGMNDLVKQLGKKYEISILTNFNKDFWELNKKWGYEELFEKEKIFVSSEIGAKKPEKEIYLFVLNALGRKPEEVIFIDDQEKNVVGAQRVGINGILFKSREQLEKELSKYV
jgi:HAD superfamily hydrolase (TIGR01509 family)